ncbi:hypothetical protein NDU88_003239 [Pleurodeles waltl]|uniref:Uncharacterized protein n=1 Tax=Pleurodeles waltl TaxID=8319 RepID=A0AAV7VGK8_PLEWA|nr:hypothetical protein NDU88_003239 [Pleurodeles waltl]
MDRGTGTSGPLPWSESTEVLRRGCEHKPLQRNLGRPQRPAGGPCGKPRLSSTVTPPAAALFSGRELLFKCRRAGDPESGRGPHRAQRTR